MTAPAPRPGRAYWERRANQQEEPMRRRTLITAACATAGLQLPAIATGHALAAPDRLRGAHNLLAALNALEGDLWDTGAAYVDPAAPAARTDLLGAAQWQWAQATSLAEHAHGNPLRPRALAVAAEAARQLAMMYADRADYPSAASLHRHATTTALAAGDYELAAWITTSRAYKPLYLGELHRAAELATRALDHLAYAERPGGRAAVCAHALLARVHAAQGDTDATNTALNAAYGAMARYTDAGSTTIPTPHHPARFAWVKLHLATAECGAALRDPVLHNRAHESALTDPSVSAMHRPMLAMGAAETTHDPAAAAHQALEILRSMDPPPVPVLGRARALAARAAQQALHTREVIELRAYVATAPW